MSVPVVEELCSQSPLAMWSFVPPRVPVTYVMSNERTDGVEASGNAALKRRMPTDISSSLHFHTMGFNSLLHVQQSRACVS